MKSADDNGEITLKCRSEDRYLAAGTDVKAAKILSPLEKFEGDPDVTCTVALILWSNAPKAYDKGMRIGVDTLPHSEH